MIKNKKLARKILIKVLIMIIAIIGICLYANYLKTVGFASLFTINAYEEAFAEITDADIKVIEFIKFAFIFLALGWAKASIEYDLDMEELRMKEKLYRMGVLSIEDI